MNPRHKAWTVRLAGLALCSLALFAYLAFAPEYAYSDGEIALDCGTNECKYNDTCYSHGACRGGQRCSGGGTPKWVDDTTCPS